MLNNQVIRLLPSQVHYYNETHAVWEPLIERVEGKTPWSLKLNVRKPVLMPSLMPGAVLLEEI